MRCNHTKCQSNENGYCLDSSYVTIDAFGKCELMWPEPDEPAKEGCMIEKGE